MRRYQQALQIFLQPPFKIQLVSADTTYLLIKPPVQSLLGISFLWLYQGITKIGGLLGETASSQEINLPPKNTFILLQRTNYSVHRLFKLD